MRRGITARKRSHVGAWNRDRGDRMAIWKPAQILFMETNERPTTATSAHVAEKQKAELAKEFGPKNFVGS